jgi:hypothetical protein
MMTLITQTGDTAVIMAAIDEAVIIAVMDPKAILAAAIVGITANRATKNALYAANLNAGSLNTHVMSKRIPESVSEPTFNSEAWTIIIPHFWPILKALK